MLNYQRVIEDKLGMLGSWAPIWGWEFVKT
jgi:hypothetical protein